MIYPFIYLLFSLCLHFLRCVIVGFANTLSIRGECSEREKEEREACGFSRVCCFLFPFFFFSFSFYFPDEVLQIQMENGTWSFHLFSFKSHDSISTLCFSLFMTEDAADLGGNVPSARTVWQRFVPAIDDIGFNF